MKLFQSSQDRDAELLSAYLDDELSAPDRAALERRLAADSGLRRSLAGLRQVKTTLAELPRLKPPRSFALKSQMVGQARPAAPARFIPALNFATTLAAILFAVVIGSEMAAGFQPLGAPAQEAQPVQVQALEVQNPAPEEGVAAADSTTLKLTTTTPAVATEAVSAAAQAPCDGGAEPLAGGGCGGVGGGGAGDTGPSTGGAGSDPAPPSPLGLTGEGTPEVDSFSTANDQVPSPTDAGTLRTVTTAEATLTPAPPDTDVPAEAVLSDDASPVRDGLAAFSQVRLAQLALGALLALLIIASILVRRR